MTTDLCSEDVVVCIASPQMISTEGGVAGGGSSRVAASSAAVELGRRLLLAARAGHTALVLDLMAKGAPFTTDWLGTSPLHLAATNNHVETCAVLLRAGVSRDSRTKVERTPLHMAAYAGHAEVVALLLQHGAQVDCRDMLRMTPLHWAAARGHAAAARALLAAGAAAAARCKFGRTARRLAAPHAELRAALELHERSLTIPPAPGAAGGPREPAEVAAQPPDRGVATVHGIQEIKQNTKTKIQQEKPTEDEQKPEQPSGSCPGARLLRKHGITMLPPDDGSTVLSALQSGRTVVLSDAGKLMLKESGGAAQEAGKALKLITLNNKLVLPHKPNKNIANVQVSGVKLVQAARRPRPPGTPVKIIVNKSNYKLLGAPGLKQPAQAEAGAEASLRAQLAAARRAIAALTAELAACKARLKQLEQH